MHLRAAAASYQRQLGQIFLTLAFLPYDAFISLDAIARTLLRLLVTHKRLLEWQTSSDSERNTCARLAGFYATMWIEPVVALAAGLFLAIIHPAQLFWALPFLVVWLAAPWIAWRISQPIEIATPDLTAEQLSFLRRTAARRGLSSKPLSPPRKTGCRPTIFRKCPHRLSLRGLRPPIWAWRCWPIWRPVIWGIFRWAA